MPLDALARGVFTVPHELHPGHPEIAERSDERRQVPRAALGDARHDDRASDGVAPQRLEPGAGPEPHDGEPARAYHRGAKLVPTLAAPAAMMLIFFSERILRLWTGDGALAQEVAPLLALLAAGALLNGLMMIPYMLTAIPYGKSGARS